jgi:carbon storage regulator
MLVLSRERGETVNIGDEIEVTVIDIRGDKVRLGVSAPRHVAVHRKEVYDAIKRQQQQAASGHQPDAGPGDANGAPPQSPDKPSPAAAPPPAPPAS